MRVIIRFRNWQRKLKQTLRGSAINNSNDQYWTPTNVRLTRRRVAYKTGQFRTFLLINICSGVGGLCLGLYGLGFRNVYSKGSEKTAENLETVLGGRGRTPSNRLLA